MNSNIPMRNSSSVRTAGLLAMALALVVGLGSCIGSKPVSYFNGNIDTTKLRNMVVPEQIIQRGDILGITIFSDNPEATAIYNQASVTSGTPASMTPTRSGATGSSTTPSGGGYLVDNNGDIRLHAIGIIHAEGRSKNDIASMVTDSLNRMGVLKNPYCIVRFNNFKITVLGEVKAPGVYTVPGEKASVLEALGLAGDITDFGRKENVMLIREDQGKQTYSSLNLTDQNIFSSPYFYLRQNDVLVVSADKRKPTAADTQTLQYITIAISFVTAFAILYNTFK